MSGNLLWDISDHLPNFLIINELTCSSYKPTIYKRNYSSYKEEGLLAEVQSVNWEEVVPAEADVEQPFDSFHNKLTEIVDKHVPLKRVSKQQSKMQSKPCNWFSLYIVSIKRKQFVSIGNDTSELSFVTC